MAAKMFSQIYNVFFYRVIFFLIVGVGDMFCSPQHIRPSEMVCIGELWTRTVSGRMTTNQEICNLVCQAEFLLFSCRVFEFLKK